MLPRVLNLTVLALFAATGCHAKFKKEAPTLGAVRVQVVMTGGPEVNLGKMYDYDDKGSALISSVVNVVQSVKEIDQTKRIAQAVEIGKVNAAMKQGLGETLGGGPPFAYSDQEIAPATLQLEVMSYGLSVPYLGAPGEFTYDIRARIYKANGDRVYKARMNCTVGAGDPSAAAVVLGVVNNVKQLKEMTNAQIQETFEVTANYCGQQWVRKMRKHAG